MHRVLLLDVAEPPDTELGSQLGQCGFTILGATDLDGAARVRTLGPDLAVIRIHDSETAAFRRSLRALAGVPVMVICAKRDPDLVIRCLKAGADTVLVAPLSRRELAARIHAVLGRRGAAGPADRVTRPRPCEVGDLMVDFDAHVVSRAGRAVSLTPTEFRLLAALARRADQTVSHAELISEVWGKTYARTHNDLRLYIRYLRRKLETDDSRPALFLNQRGVGYRLAAGTA